MKDSFACNNRECAMDRRTFLADSAVAAALLALAACSLDATGPPVGEPISNTITVADYPQIANVGGILVANLNGAPLALVRTGAASFAALSLVCPHQGATVNTAAGGFRCPRHGARFDTTGKWNGGQPTSDLRTRNTSYDPATDTLKIS